MGNVLNRARILAALPLLPAAVFAQSTVTGVTTVNIDSGNPALRTGLPGYSNVGSGAPYDISYNGFELKVTSVTTATATYTPSGSGQAYMRRSGAAESFPDVNPNQTSAWNALLAGNNNTTAHTVSGQYINTMDALFTGQNLLTGTENLFVNSGDANNVSGNIERVDYIFAGGFSVTAADAFAVFERGGGPGGTGANGGFYVAAITGLSGTIPTAFGPLVSVIDNSYNNGGNGIGLTPFRYDVFRYDVAGGPELDAVGNVDIGPQGISAVLFDATDLAPLSSTIYGYAIFPEDVNLAGDLTQWTDNSVYPQNSTTAVDVDLVAGGASRFTETEVPEASTTAALVSVGLLAGGTVVRRRFFGK